MFLVHRTTLWRRLKYEEKNLVRHTMINDSELMSVMREIVNSQPHTGQLNRTHYHLESEVIKEVKNVLVTEIYGKRRGSDRGSFIAGKSVHNSRIERLWRDVYYAVIQTFYSLFYYLEGNDLLDVDNQKDLLCLHYVFIPRINEALSQFVVAYNSHGLRTERCWSPQKIWVNSMIQKNIHSAELNSENILIDGIEQYGIDPQVNDVQTHGEDIGSLDMLNMQPDHVIVDVDNLLSQVDPLIPSNEHGVDVYLAAREIVRHDDV
ncbi:unnamed protein product [Mytilus coruscus]|uniref:Integrase core domain-containing protein n=1 Tax=Mytilus coruscus TaxID=42192 RepID=A0A6J8AH11_MYTCO|nr:unnamed protein product [Mytilus coruscus]